MVDDAQAFGQHLGDAIGCANPVGVVVCGIKEIGQWFSDLTSGKTGNQATYTWDTPAKARMTALAYMVDPYLMFGGVCPASLQGILDLNGMPCIQDANAAVGQAKTMYQFAGLDATGSPLVDTGFWAQVQKDGQASNWTPGPTPYINHSPAEASALLSAMRGDAASLKWNLDLYSVVSDARPNFARAVKALRVRAGECGPDGVLGAVAGDVTVANADASNCKPELPGKNAQGTYVNSHGAPLRAGVDTYDGGLWVWSGSDWVPNAINASDGSWWWVGLTAAAALIIGGGLVYRERKGRLFATAGTLALEPPGQAAFRRVLERGLVDGELQYLRSGMRSRVPFDRAFQRASRLHGITSTQLASTGRYFGEEVLPIRVEVYDDGSVHLGDGRHRYLAAKDAGARAILAEVVLYDADGAESAARTAVVRLV